MLTRSSLMWARNNSTNLNANSCDADAVASTASSANLQRLKNVCIASLMDVLGVIVEEATVDNELDLRDANTAVNERSKDARGPLLLRGLLWQRVRGRERIVRHALTGLFSLTEGGVSGGLGYVPSGGATAASISFNDDDSTQLAQVCMTIIDGSRGPWSMRVTRLAIRLLAQILPRLPLRLTGRQVKGLSPSSSAKGVIGDSKEAAGRGTRFKPSPYPPQFDPGTLPQRLLQVVGNLALGFDPRGGIDLGGGSCAAGGISKMKSSNPNETLAFGQDAMAAQFAAMMRFLVAPSSSASSTASSAAATAVQSDTSTSPSVLRKEDTAETGKSETAQRKAISDTLAVKEDSFLWGYQEKQDAMLAQVRARVNEVKVDHQTHFPATSASESNATTSTEQKDSANDDGDGDLWVVTIREGRYLNIRSDPSLKNQPIGKFERGTVLRVLRKVPADTTNSRIPKRAVFLKIALPPSSARAGHLESPGIGRPTSAPGRWGDRKDAASGAAEAWVLSESEREQLVMPLSGGGNTREVYKGFTLLLHANTSLPADKFFREIQERVRIAISKSARQEGCQWPHRGWQGCEGEFQKVFIKGVLKCGMGPIIRKCTRLECETVAMRLARYGFATTIVDENSAAASACDPGGAGLGRIRAYRGLVGMSGSSGGKSSGDKDRVDRNKELSDGAAKAGIPASWYGGTTSAGITSELVALLRSLLTSDAVGGTAGSEGQYDLLRSGSGAQSTRADLFRDAISSYVDNLTKYAQTGNGFSGHVSETSSSPSSSLFLSSSLPTEDLAKGVGALLVMGGASGCGPLRIGSRVEVTTGPTTTATGVVTRFHVGEPTVGVVLDSESTSDVRFAEQDDEVSFATVAVQPIDMVDSLDEASLPVTPRLASALLDIVDKTHYIASGTGGAPASCTFSEVVERSMPWYVAAEVADREFDLNSRPESSSEGDVEAVFAARAAGLVPTEGDAKGSIISEETKLAARAAGLEEGCDSDMSSSGGIGAFGGQNEMSRQARLRAQFSTRQRNHPAWIAAFLRTRALSVLWSGLISDQLPVMNVINNSASTKLLRGVAENSLRLEAKKSNNTIGEHDQGAGSGQSSNSDAILSSAAGDLKRLEMRSAHVQASHLDRLFESQESLTSSPSNLSKNSSNSSHYNVVDSLGKVLSFPAGLDPRRTSGVIMATDAMVSGGKVDRIVRPGSAKSASASTLVATENGIQNRTEKYNLKGIRVVDEPLLLNPRKIFPPARPSMLVTDRPVPQHLSTYYFEVHFSGLPMPPLYAETRGVPTGNNASHDAFMVGLWVGGSREHDSRAQTLPPDAPGCIWFHPRTGHVFQGGRLIKTFKPDRSAASHWDAPWKPDAVSYVVGVLWDLDRGSVSFVRGAPQGSPPVLLGTLDGVMFPAGMRRQQESNLSSMRDVACTTEVMGATKAAEKAEETTQQDQDEDKPAVTSPARSLPGLVYPAFRMSGMTGTRARLVLGLNSPLEGVQYIKKKQPSDTFLWGDGKKCRATVAPKFSTKQIKERILEWYEACHTYSRYVPPAANSVALSSAEDKALITKLLSVKVVTMQKKVPPSARLCYRARKHAKLTLSAMFPDMQPALLEAIVIETDFNMQVATEVCLGMDPRLQSIQRNVNSGRSNARRSTMGQTFAEISLRATLLDHVLSQHGNFDQVVALEKQPLWHADDGSVKNGIAKDMRIVAIEGDHSDPDKDGTTEGMHLAEGCDVRDAWAIVPAQCYQTAYPDVVYTRILALLEGQGAAGVVWLVNPPYGDEDQALTQVDFGKSSSTAASSAAQQSGLVSDSAVQAAAEAAAAAAAAAGLSAEARAAAVQAAAVRAASAAMLASRMAGSANAPSSNLDPFALPIVLVRASTPLYDFSEMDMINGWSLRVYVQHPQEQLVQQLSKNEQASSASAEASDNAPGSAASGAGGESKDANAGDYFPDGSASGSVEAGDAGAASYAVEADTTFADGNSADGQAHGSDAAAEMSSPFDPAMKSKQQLMETAREFSARHLLRRSWFCTSDEHAEERSATVKRDYEVELENWVYGIKRLLERARLERPQIDGIVAHLQAGDPDGMGMFQLRDIHPPLPEAALKRPEKRQDLMWRKSGEWPLRLQEAWVGHVVKVSSKANEIMMGSTEDESRQRSATEKCKNRTLEAGSSVILDCRGVNGSAFGRPTSSPVDEPFWCTVLSVNDNGTVDLSCMGQSLLASGVIRSVPEHLVRTPVIISGANHLKHARGGSNAGAYGRYLQARSEDSPFSTMRSSSAGNQYSFGGFGSPRMPGFMSASHGTRATAAGRGPVWVSRMMSTLGRAGRIVEVDTSQREAPLMMLEFYDPESLRLTRWWYSLKALCSPSSFDLDTSEIDDALGESSSNKDSNNAAVSGEEEHSNSSSVSKGSASSSATSEGGGGISTEIALGRMYAQRLLLESWTQSRRQANTLTGPTVEGEKTTSDNIMDETFFMLAVADCFGPLHATAKRASENLGASSASGITSGVQGVMSCRFESPDTPNRGALLRVLEDALPKSFANGLVRDAFARSAQIMLDTSTAIRHGGDSGTSIALNNAIEVICHEPCALTGSKSHHSPSGPSSMLVHFGQANIIPDKSALCVYNSVRCSEATRLRRCRSTAAANASTPIWTSSKSVYFRFEGRRSGSGEGRNNGHQRPRAAEKNDDSSASGACLDVRACMVSCEFWYACWAIEKLLGSLEVDFHRKKSGSSSSWQLQHISPSILSLLEFATMEQVPPACRHVAHRLLVRLVRCSMHLHQSRGVEQVMFGSKDQHAKVRQHLSTLAVQLNALVEYDLKASMKVTDGMRTMGALDAMASRPNVVDLGAESVTASMDESQLSQAKSEAANSTADQNHPLARLPDTNFGMHTQTLVELVSVFRWSLGDDLSGGSNEDERSTPAMDAEDGGIMSDNENSEPTCESCGEDMVVSTYSREDYESGYCCDECGGRSFDGLRGGSRERWLCLDCHTDICFDCWPKERGTRVRTEGVALKATDGVTGMMKVLYSSIDSIPEWFVLQALEKRIYPVLKPQIGQDSGGSKKDKEASTTAEVRESSSSPEATTEGLKLDSRPGFLAPRVLLQKATAASDEGKQGSEQACEGGDGANEIPSPAQDEDEEADEFDDPSSAGSGPYSFSFEDDAPSGGRIPNPGEFFSFLVGLVATARACDTRPREAACRGCSRRRGRRINATP